MSNRDDEKHKSISLNNDPTHQLLLHARQGHNKLLSESILPLILCFACPFFDQLFLYVIIVMDQ